MLLLQIIGIAALLLCPVTCSSQQIIALEEPSLSCNCLYVVFAWLKSAITKLNSILGLDWGDENSPGQIMMLGCKGSIVPKFSCLKGVAKVSQRQNTLLAENQPCSSFLSKWKTCISLQDAHFLQGRVER